MDQYLTSIREIEARIENSERMPVANPGMETPGAVPARYDEHIALMFDLLLLAFQTDTTRVATVLIAREGSNRISRKSASPRGITSHASPQPAEMIDKVKQIDRWTCSASPGFCRTWNRSRRSTAAPCCIIR